MAYAQGTSVPVERTINEIMALVKKAGASRVGHFEEPERYTVQFQIAERMVRFRVAIQTPLDFAKRGARPASNTEMIAAAEQATRQRLRALLLVIKAKLESVTSEVETFEQAFLSQVVMADGDTVHDRIAGQIALEYDDGAPRPLLLSGPNDGRRS